MHPVGPTCAQGVSSHCYVTAPLTDSMLHCSAAAHDAPDALPVANHDTGGPHPEAGLLAARARGSHIHWHCGVPCSCLPTFHKHCCRTSNACPLAVTSAPPPWLCCLLQGNIAAWRKQEGDSLAPGDVLAEVETDKATMEWECQEEGYIAKIVKPAGQGHQRDAGQCQQRTDPACRDTSAMQRLTPNPSCPAAAAERVVLAARPHTKMPAGA
jgi:hypothetical protein